MISFGWVVFAWMVGAVFAAPSLLRRRMAQLICPHDDDTNHEMWFCRAMPRIHPGGPKPRGEVRTRGLGDAGRAMVQALAWPVLGPAWLLLRVAKPAPAETLRAAREMEARLAEQAADIECLTRQLKSSPSGARVSPTTGLRWVETPDGKRLAFADEAAWRPEWVDLGPYMEGSQWVDLGPHTEGSQ